MPHSAYALLGANIKDRREAVGMNQDVLASKVGLSRTSVTNIERGRQSVLVHQLISFADALGVEATSLLPSKSEFDAPKARSVSAEVAELMTKLQPRKPRT